MVFYIAIKGGARGDSLCEISVSEAVNRNFNKCNFIESTKGMVGPERGKIKLKPYKNNYALSLGKRVHNCVLP